MLVLIFLLPLSLSGVEPDEILKDKILEERARIISSDLRCLVCQNENIDSSNADLAKDLRFKSRVCITSCLSTGVLMANLSSIPLP